jgi:hypothetical protein
MPEIKGLFPRAPSVYGWHFEGEKDQILDLVHNTYKRCHFKNCEVIIPDTSNTLIVQSIVECQFDNCEITIIKRAGYDVPENRGVHPNKQILTPIAMHIDVRDCPNGEKNMISVRVDHAVKAKLGQGRTITWMKYLMSQGQHFAFRFR